MKSPEAGPKGKHTLKDGVYVVDKHQVVAAFIVKDGKVTACSPILRAKFQYWLKFAKWFCE